MIYGLKPKHPLGEDYISCQMAILPDNFFTEADKGKIMFKRMSKWWFLERGVECKDNTKLEDDVVILQQSMLVNIGPSVISEIFYIKHSL